MVRRGKVEPWSSELSWAAPVALRGVQFVQGIRRRENLTETLPPSIPESMGVRRNTSDCSVYMSCGGTGEGETSEEKQMFILFCCLKPIHRFTLDSQDCLQSWEGRQYCPRTCWGTMEGNTDSENDTDGGVVARGCEQDSVGGADVRNCTPLLDPAFCIPALLSQQPPGRLWGPCPGPLPAESSQGSLINKRVSGIPSMLTRPPIMLSALMCF